MHATAVQFQIVNHQLFPLIDANQAAGRFVVIDPMDRNHILYLTDKAYLDYSRVAMSNDSVLVVLARPGEDVAGLQAELKSRDSNRSSSSRSSDENKHNPLNMKGVYRPKFFEELGISRSSLETIYGLDLSQITEEEVHHFVQDFLLVGEGTSGPLVEKLMKSAEKFFAEWMFPVRPGGEFNFLALKDRNIRHLIKYWGGILSIRFGFSVSNMTHRISILQVAHHLYLISRDQGIDTAILRMKVAVLVIYTYMAGNVLTDTRHLGAPVQLIHGLPAFLPRSVRQSLRAGNIATVRLYTSLLTAYKAIQGTWKLPDLASIENTPFLKPLDSVTGFLPEFWGWISRHRPEVRFPCLKELRIPFSTKSGVNFRVAPLSSAFDALAWAERSGGELVAYLAATGAQDLLGLFFRTLTWLSQFPEWTLLELGGRFPRDPEGVALGKLALKKEAAGKVRTFAIVDWWTQCALKPLHDWIFSILKALPTDASFDQEGAVSSFHAENRGEDFFSYDLSAATDNIPVAATTRVLSYALGPKVANAWRDLLINRDYELPPPLCPAPSERRVVRYGRGQPIGALSSWPALALTHHFVVQLAAHRVGLFPFYGYRVLGDDIVIAGESVARSYESVCRELEIPINTKGILSFVERAQFGTLFNFANQVIIGDENISPMSLKEEMSIVSLSGRLESLLRCYRRGLLKVSSSFLANMVRIGGNTISRVSAALQSMTQGELPGQLRGIIALTLYPVLATEGDLLPSGAIIGDEGSPMWRSISILFRSGKDLYDGSANTPPPGFTARLPGDSLARKYWATMISELQERLNRISITPFSGPVIHWSTRALAPRPTDCLQQVRITLGGLRVPDSSARLLAYNQVILGAMMVNCRPSDHLDRVQMARTSVAALARANMIQRDNMIASSSELSSLYIRAVAAVDRITTIPMVHSDIQFGQRLLEMAEEERRVREVVNHPIYRTDLSLFSAMTGGLPAPDPSLGGTEGLGESLWI